MTAHDDLYGPEEREHATAVHGLAEPIRQDMSDPEIHAWHLSAHERMTDDARERARRLVEAEAAVAGLSAERDLLAERVSVAEFDRAVAEGVLSDMETMYPAKVYLPGDAAPEYDHERPVILAGVMNGAIYVQTFDADRWRALASSHTYESWQGVLGEGPCIEITGRASKRLVDRMDEDEDHRHRIRSSLWGLERDALADYIIRDLGIERDRERAGSPEEADAIVRNTTRVVGSLWARLRTAERAADGQSIDAATAVIIAGQERDLDRTRGVAAKLEGELADLRRAIEAIHYPDEVPMESSPEEPEIICPACRTSYPCETRSFSDALDPVNGLDEFADRPDPF